MLMRTDRNHRSSHREIRPVQRPGLRGMAITRRESVPMSTHDSSPTGYPVILVVDDDSIFRGFCQATLQYLGYTVLAASSGEEGIEMLAGEGDRIGLVILDLLLPDITGKKMYERITDIRPGMPVIISTGLDIDSARDVFEGLDPSRFIMKPFSIRSLSAAIRNTLNSGDDCS
jgi:two-component system, cell cycle sensor histidine kinase and response regulator CckA